MDPEVSAVINSPEWAFPPESGAEQVCHCWELEKEISDKTLP